MFTDVSGGERNGGHTDASIQHCHRFLETDL